MENKPYVKQYDSKGVLINPIVGSYTSPYDNRRTRRAKEGRYSNNKKGIQLVVSPIGYGSFIKFHKVRQVIDGNKTIVHYILK